jgi:hypothetical protein
MDVAQFIQTNESEPAMTPRRRGRPLKFGRPAQLLTITLPHDVVAWLQGIHADPAWAIVSLYNRLVPPGSRAPRRAQPRVELAGLAGRRALIGGGSLHLSEPPGRFRDPDGRRAGVSGARAGPGGRGPRAGHPRPRGGTAARLRPSGETWGGAAARGAWLATLARLPILQPLGSFSSRGTSRGPGGRPRPGRRAAGQGPRRGLRRRSQ